MEQIKKNSVFASGLLAVAAVGVMAIGMALSAMPVMIGSVIVGMGAATVVFASRNHG